MNDDDAAPLPPSRDGGAGAIGGVATSDGRARGVGGGGRRLLASSYRSYRPRDLGDRYVSFLLGDERASRALMGRVTMDHLAVIRRLQRGGGGGGGDRLDDLADLGLATTTTTGDDDDEDEARRGAGGIRAGSIEIDAFQLLTHDPVLGNLTLRYPDTLLELLEDSTVRARRIIRGRMEAALRAALEDDATTTTTRMGDGRDDDDVRGRGRGREGRRARDDRRADMARLHAALRRTGDRYSPRPLRARLVRLPPHSGFCKATLSSISASDVGTVVQVCGTCVRTGPVRMMETTRTYRCTGRGGCGAMFSAYADFGTSNNALPTPIVCPNLGDDGDRCRSTSFALVPEGSVHADYQEIKVQESVSALSRVGSVPRSMLIKLGDDLVDMCNPGDEVVVVGSLHAHWHGQNGSVDGVEAMVGMCMRAHSVRVINAEEGFGGGGGGGGGMGGMADLTLAGMSGSGNLREKFRREFDAFWSSETSRRRPFATRDYIARAVCPKLYGMHAVKLGLLLVLIGGASVSLSSESSECDGASVGEEEDDIRQTGEEGSDAMDAPVAFKIENEDDDRRKSRSKNGKSQTNNSSEKAVKRRIQSHILLIGDPGTGKSQFLRFAAALSPRSVLTTGTGSSTAGLTCAAVRGDGNEFSLEAGALALADRGVCCIDEFGCMSKEDRTSIHEAMEQQTISVAKAGIICKLNARATVVAVMNPTCGGIYDESLSLEKNSRLGSALLSRFDMIFVMLDQAQCERDVNIAHFLLQQSIIPGSGYDRSHGMALAGDDSVNGHWGMEKLRAYIATIREKFHPTLTPEASELLENHYSLCRQRGNCQTLVTVRFLESLIRLSQAHARLMYRDKVLLDDAVAVILLMECTAAASSGRMFGGGGVNYSSDYQFDDCLAKNPIDTEFRPVNDGGGTRAGFFIGDGAGIGKGRQISATILDALCRNYGGGRHLWVSVSRELVQDARRDLADVGCRVDVHDGAEALDRMSHGGKKGKGLGAGGSLGRGVLFVTYSLLVSGRRMEDIIAWLSGGGGGGGSGGGGGGGGSKKLQGVDGNRERSRVERSYAGVIVFDEAHKAKNLEADTRTAKLVLALQERLPMARVLYCSATGVSDIKHMVYASRLGLWGGANPLYPTFESFHGALAKRGVGAMEMLALEMKRKGMFLARTLSWDGAEFHTLEVKLSEEATRRYDGAVRWWLNVKNEINSALEFMNIPAPKLLWSIYWSAHQRFSREMCICAKIDAVVAQAKQYLQNDDHAIVIGLQSTGEAGMEVALEELAESAAESAGRRVHHSDAGKIDFEDMSLTGLVSTCASVMSNFIRNHFPVALPSPEVPKVPSIPPNGFASEADRLEHKRLSDLADRMKNEPPPKPIIELVIRRNELLESVRSLDLPPNPLDDIIDRLGGVENVAEMTGRTGRVLRAKSGKYKFVKRCGGPSKQKSYGLSVPVSAEDENDRLNIAEKRSWMDGKKSVAIISDAASTGISLHADSRCKSSHKRRVHFTIELPWAADKAIQQLGRSHRSGQETAPIYKMVVTDLGGERRFASAVAKRMAALGALTKGDRRAATGTNLSDFDIDSVFGKRALGRTYTALHTERSAPSRNANDILDKFVTTDEVAVQMKGKDCIEKRSFALAEASNALIEVGLMGDPNVKKFLNRIAGLDVARQTLVFSLFMATLDDVIVDAKATGEFEGSVEDIRATRVTLKSAPEVIATDQSCGAVTTFTRLVLDRGISFNSIVQTVIDGNECASGETSNENEDQCKSGFYLSRRKIAGRYLIMFAQRKVEKKFGIDEDFIDPLNLMVISRPNTGKNPCEMPSQELRYKYKLLVSSADLLDSIKIEEFSDTDGEEKTDKDRAQPKDAIGIIRDKWGGAVADLWDDAFDNSNFADHHDGLAPRISEVGLITGAVLHILPSLEKAVQFMPQSQRSLRVIRVELSDSGQRIVGIKFPVSNEAIERLMAGMKEVVNARQGSMDSPSFVDEAFSPVDIKAMSWATSERKTMKSFFSAASKEPGSNRNSSSELGKRNGLSAVSPFLQNASAKKQKAISTNKGPSNQKSAASNISSFFGVRGTI
ncbi:hypothetical protein ACHAW5_001191 [Stephanodiscus triporus]|uniref:DNA helicase n=1 Tax=Stephanodiscus triporus TaxID=2934178 RepID=A0ABD3NJ56_9STRA